MRPNNSGTRGLTEVTNRLKLKDKPVQVESPCSQDEIDNLWEKVHEIDSSVQKTDSKQAQPSIAM